MDDNKKVNLDSEIIHEDVIDISVNDDVELSASEARKTKWYEINFKVNVILFIIATISYLLLGFLCNSWHNAWILFLIPDTIASIFRCIAEKSLSKFSIVFLCCIIYFFLCMVSPGLEANMWGKLWYIFILIPLYYITIDRIEGRHGEESEDEESDN